MLEKLPQKYIEYAHFIKQNADIYVRQYAYYDYSMAKQIKIYMLISIYFYRKFNLQIHILIPEIPRISENWYMGDESEFYSVLNDANFSFMEYLVKNSWKHEFHIKYTDIDEGEEHINNFRSTRLTLFDDFVDIIRETAETTNYYTIFFDVFSSEKVATFLKMEKNGNFSEKTFLIQKIHTLMDKIACICNYNFFDMKEYGDCFYIIFCTGYIEEVLNDQLLCPDMMIPFYIKELDDILDILLNKEGETVNE